MAQIDITTESNRQHEQLLIIICLISPNLKDRVIISSFLQPKSCLVGVFDNVSGTFVSYLTDIRTESNVLHNGYHIYLSRSYTDEQHQALSDLSVITSTVSLISCLCIVICWVMFKDLRNLAYGFVFYMAIATIIRTQSKMWGGYFHKGDAMCTIQGFLITYGGLSTFYWMLTVAMVMHTLIFFPIKWRKATWSCKNLSLSINFSVPLLFAILPVLTNDYENVGGMG